MLTVFKILYGTEYKPYTEYYKRTGHTITYDAGPQRGLWRYISTLSLTSALDMGGWSTPRRGCFTPR
jgi:hypothetical protein